MYMWYVCVLVVYACVCRPCATKRKASPLSLYVEYAQYLLFNEKFASSAADRRIHHHYKSIESSLARMCVCALCVCGSVFSVYECVFSACMCIRIWWALLSIAFLDPLLLYAATAVLLLVGWLVGWLLLLLLLLLLWLLLLSYWSLSSSRL